MKKLIFFIPLTITILLFGFLLYYILQNKDVSNPPSALLNKEIPIFIATNLYNKNSSFNQEILIGKTALINFFSSWCEPCKLEHPILMEIFHSDNDIIVLGFNFKDDRNDAIKFIENYGNPYDKIGVDNTGKIAMDFGVYGLPETFLVNNKGNIVFKHVGPITKKIYNEEIKKLLTK